jgi:phosphatidylserine/phosphatidylglycerophosphate/cardiolipin synthase-like enzyme
VTVEGAIQVVLTRLSDAQVETLASACESQRQPAPSVTNVAAGSSPGAHDAIATLTAAWTASSSLTGSGVALALRVGLRARRDADARRSRPVWTGPGAAGEQRLTASVLHDLVCDASSRILIVSFAAYTLAEIAADLEAAAGRGCEVDVVFETEEDSAGKYAGPASKPFGGLHGARRWRWPATQRTSGALLHAKLLVIDGRRALVGSANLTHRALTANLEAGVLIEDPELASDLEDHVRSLIRGGTLVAVDPI